ncbi:ABC transporter permease [Micromonospora sp. NPDC047707]|uniref:ABC transporter permease n=1 Tax=Micromonospora sp. NPDC047707 TaxID=3154498 RepID=UPI0034527377
MTIASAPDLETRPSAGVRPLLGRLVRRPAGAFGLAVVAALVLVAVFAPYVVPYDGAVQDIPNRLQGPSGSHLLGTDGLGRDLLSRILLGVRVELAVALPAVCAALVLGLLLGLVAGYLGGWVDNAVVVFMDTIQAFPSVVLALVLVAVLGPSLTNLVIVVAITFAPQSARVTRASVLALRQSPFIEAERALGASTLRIIGVHVLPNVIAPLFILLAMNIPSAITVEAGLSFLGMGVQPPTPSWGVILSDGFADVYEAPWAVLWTALALVLTTIGFTTLGETLRDVSDPRLSGAKGLRYDR